jgi:hypothetical protein
VVVGHNLVVVVDHKVVDNLLLIDKKINNKKGKANN